VDHFGFFFPESISLVSAIEILPNTAYFFAASAAALLATDPKDIPGRHQGFAFGYLVAFLLVHFRTIRSESWPGTRFTIYWQPELPSGLEWERRCTLKTLACLQFHAAYGWLLDKKKRAIQYKKLRRHFCSTTTNCDLLITNHVLGISSCLGLLPAWVRGLDFWLVSLLQDNMFGDGMHRHLFWTGRYDSVWTPSSSSSEEKRCSIISLTVAISIFIVCEVGVSDCAAWNHRQGQ
jgi:hypothetical protein